VTAPAKKRSVLVVEPGLEILDRVVPALERREYGVQFFHSGEEGLLGVRDSRPELVFLEDAPHKRSSREWVRDLVRVAPFSLCVLITDMEGDEVHERMESLGIVGWLSREAGSSEIEALLDHVEKVIQVTEAFSPARNVSP